MYPTARRRRCRTNINTFGGSTVRRKPKCRPIEQLCDIHDPTVDVAPDVVGIVSFHFACIECVGSAYSIPESRCKTFHLVGNRLRHVFTRSIRHVAIRPSRVLARGCPRCIEHALLCKQHKGLLRVTAFPHQALAFRDFMECAAQMHSAGKAGLFRPERYGLTQSPIDFKYAHSVPMALQLPPV